MAYYGKSAGLSVAGNASSSASPLSDITAASDNQVLRRSGTSIGFGQVNIASSAAVTGILSPTNGGTGINNGTSDITLGGDILTTGKFNTVGGFDLSLTLTGTTTLTLPTSGTLVNTAVTTLSNLSSIGTITTGVWNGTVIAGQYGGTGVANTGLTINLGSGALGKVLVSDVSGNATWAALSGIGVTSITGTANQIAASASVGAVTLSLTNGISLGSYQAIASPTGGLIAPGNVSIGSSSAGQLFNVGSANQFQINSIGQVLNPILFDSNGGTAGDLVSFQGAENPIVNSAGIQANHGFLVNANVTNVWGLVISDTFGANPTFTLTNGISLYLAAGATVGTVTNGYSLMVDNPGFGTNKYSIWSKGANVFGSTGPTAGVGRLFINSSGTIIGPLSEDNNSVETANGTAVSITGVIPGRTGGSPWLTLSGMLGTHNFTVQDNTTYAAEIETSPTFTVPTATTISNGLGIRLGPGNAVLSGTGVITNGVNLEVEEPAFGTTKFAARLKGRVDIGTTGQASFSRLGVLTLGTPLAVTNGGTGTGTAFTAGSVVFAGASGVYSQDNANFFWDATNHRLGLYNTTPSYIIDIAGPRTTRITQSFTGNQTSSNNHHSLSIDPTYTTSGATNLIGQIYINGTINATGGAVTRAAGIFVDSGAAPSGTISTGYGIYINNPSYGTQKWAGFFDGALGAGNYAHIIGGATTAATSTLLTLNSSIQAQSRITLAGQEFNSAGNTSNDGIALVIGTNRTGNRQLYIGDSAALAQNSTNQMIRFVLGSGIPNPGIDAQSTNATALALTLQQAGGNLALFAAGSFGSGSQVIYIANRAAAPSGNPAGGGILYIESGALKYKGSGGTVSTVAPA